MWTSTDGQAWSRVAEDGVFGGEGQQAMNDVTAGGPGLVAVGHDGGNAAVWVSSDGLSWMRVPHDEAVFGGEAGQQMRAVTVGGPGLVAVGIVGLSGAVWTSVDGIEWSRVPHDETTFPVGTQAMSVIPAGPGLVAVGAYADPNLDFDAAVWTSSDGLTWSRVSNDQPVFGGEGQQTMRDITAGGSGLVAVGTDGPFMETDAAVWTSPDGLAWSRVSSDDAVFGGADEQMMLGVASGLFGVLAVGFDNSGGDWEAAVWTSPDGVVWLRDDDSEGVFGDVDEQYMSSVIVGGPGLVAVGKGSHENAAVWIGTNPE